MDIARIRKQFPALSRKINGRPTIYLDGPAGTQVPERVIEAISQYYHQSNANTHGYFTASRETDELLERTRDKVATFLGAPSGACISFGSNMTSLNYSLSRALVRDLSPGDEILISQLDHEANRGPWLALKSFGVQVREIPLLPSGVLDYDAYTALLTDRVKLVCVGYASNIFGTVNDVVAIREQAHAVGARVVVDAVHYAPHLPLDVSALGCDFLLCSAYKFYGPHVGILYARKGLLDQLHTDRLRTQEQVAPYKIETGTLNHAAIAGVEAAIDFVADLASGADLRERILGAMTAIGRHERHLIQVLAKGLDAIPGVTLYGPSTATAPRAPTISFTVEGMDPVEVCKALGQQNIYAWDGHFYAIRSMEVFDLLKVGGVTRMGVVVYNTLEEVQQTVAAVAAIVGATVNKEAQR